MLEPLEWEKIGDNWEAYEESVNTSYYAYFEDWWVVCIGVGQRQYWIETRTDDIETMKAKTEEWRIKWRKRQLEEYDALTPFIDQYRQDIAEFEGNTNES